MRISRTRSGSARILAVVAVCACAALAAAALTTAAPAGAAHLAAQPASSSTAAGYRLPAVLDVSDLSWRRAFDGLHEKMVREYAFTAWKGIAWESLYAEYQPRIARAQAAGDADAYYLALREYTHEFRDGHVSVIAADEDGQALMAGAQYRLAGGGFGLIATRLDDGRVVASWVKAGEPAAEAGIKTGAELVSWGGAPIKVALSRTSTTLSPNMPTDWRRSYEQARFLVRAPVGAARAVSFRNPSAGTVRSARVTAVDDGLETLTMTNAGSVLSWGTLPASPVESRLLAGNVGYVRLSIELDVPDTPKTLDLFRDAIRSFLDAKVSSLIVDLRNNAGGYDHMATQILGSLYTGKAFYEYADLYNPLTGTFQIWVGDDATGTFVNPGQGLWIEPAAPSYAGHIVTLVNNGCVSTGEGLSMGIKRLANARVVGFVGTNGSFGVAGDRVVMPGGLEIHFPFGRTLDKDHVVQIDARHGKGGVSPADRIPMTLRNAVRHWKGDDVELEYGLKVLKSMTK